MNFTCPRRKESFAYTATEDDDKDYLRSGTCSYCGSVDPDYMIERLIKGDVEITPTDKNYKIYVDSKTNDSIGKKFYFQHFTDGQQKEFIRLLNGDKLNLKSPGHFYVAPFFIRFKE